jgi:hypothetical protein
LTIVALVRRVEVTSTKVSYLLDDCTGGVTGVFWLESADGVGFVFEWVILCSTEKYNNVWQKRTGTDGFCTL